MKKRNMMLAGVALVLAVAETSAWAQMNLGARRNSNQPIEIASDNLEVFQDRQLAIFRGSVDVVQGEMRLRADELFVYYRDNKAQAPGGKPPPPATKPAPSAGGPDMGSITRLEAKGKVFISSPTEQAQGDYADYDVDKKLTVMRGNVLLTQKGSVLRCDTVIMHQDTGNSECKPPAGGRVRGVFQQSGPQ